MSLHQTVEPTPHPTQVRAMAYDLAVKEQGGMLDVKFTLERAKKIEEYLWGKFAPIEKAATPLNTIEETLEHALHQLVELSCNTDPQRSVAINECSANIRRVIADLTLILTT